MPTDFPTPQQMSQFEHAAGAVINAIPWFVLSAVIVLFGLFILKAILILLLRIINVRRLLNQKTVLLQLIPPAFNDKPPIANRELFTRLHGWDDIRPLLDKLSRFHALFSAEIAASRPDGIRYILRVPAEAVTSFEKDIASLSPDIRVQQVEDYLPRDLDLRNVLTMAVRQTGRSFAYPLNFLSSHEQYDPVAGLTSAMTRLQPGEVVSLQIVLAPVRIRKAGAIARRLLHNGEHMESLGGKRGNTAVRLILRGISSSLFTMTDLVGEIHHGPSNYKRNSSHTIAQHKEQAAIGLKPSRSLTTIEQDLAESVYGKLSQPLFSIAIRVLIVAESPVDRRSKAKDLQRSLGSLKTNYQSLQARFGLFQAALSRYRLFLFKNRLLNLRSANDCILSTEEVAGIFHFPHSQTARIEGVVKSLSKTMPVPLAVKRAADSNSFDVILGQNCHHGIVTSIGLTEPERERHVYVIGGTGNGKTTLLQYSIVQDMKKGKGIAVIDPHGDMAEALLRHVPKDRINDVIYFNPDDIQYPIGINLLELPEGLPEDELMREKDLITESVISIFRKIFSDEDTGGHRIEYVLRNAIQTALTVDDATLFTIFDLLNDPDYRKSVTKKLQNKDLKNFWKHELGKAGEMQKVKMSAGITAKIGRFLFSASAKRILEQPKSTIDFDDIINSGKILICNFSKGLLGEDTSELFGITVLAKLQLASLKRARLQQQERKPFYVYVDEFQNFATPSFVQMLSESRKYKLYLTMAEQSTSQQKDQQMVNVILANVGTVICFRTGNPQDEALMLPLFQPYIEQGEISSLPPFNFYAKFSAAQPQEPLSGETLLLAHSPDESIAAEIISASRNAYARKLEKIDPVQDMSNSAETDSSGQDDNGEDDRPPVCKMLDVTD